LMVIASELRQAKATNSIRREETAMVAAARGALLPPIETQRIIYASSKKLLDAAGEAIRSETKWGVRMSCSPARARAAEDQAGLLASKNAWS
jgi:hypothetical protein